MIKDKETPNEYVSLRNIWLRRIEDCGRAISQLAVQEPNVEREWREIGNRTICYSVDALFYSLVDYGEAFIRSDVNEYREKVYRPQVRRIWSNNNECSNNQKWDQHRIESIKLYDKIIQVLNKYNMLFEDQPRGYTNVEMRSV